MQRDTSAGLDEVVGAAFEPALRNFRDRVTEAGESDLEVRFRAYRLVTGSLVEPAVG